MQPCRATTPELLERLCKGVDYEQRNGCHDIKGSQQLFSSFLKTSLSTILENHTASSVQMEATCQEISRLKSLADRYRWMTRDERRVVLADVIKAAETLRNHLKNIHSSIEVKEVSEMIRELEDNAVGDVALDNPTTEEVCGSFEWKVRNQTWEDQMALPFDPPKDCIRWVPIAIDLETTGR